MRREVLPHLTAVSAAGPAPALPPLTPMGIRRRVTTGAWRLCLGAVILFAQSCAEATGTPPESVAGRTFEVVAVEGSRLPTAILVTGRGACSAVMVFRAELDFGVDGAFEQRLWYSSEPAANPAVFRTAYTQDSDGRVHIEGNGGSGSLRGDTLAFTLDPGLVCERYRWTAVAQQVQ